MKKEIKGLRKLSTEEMEKVSGGNCFLAMASYGLASHNYATSPSGTTFAEWTLALAEMVVACER